jgi:hypothetical protein
MEINLIAAASLSMTSSHRNLMPASRFEIAAPAIARSDTGQPSGDIVWSASAHNDGSFDFGALLNFENDRPSGKRDSLSMQVTSSDTQDAAFLYSTVTNMQASMYGKLISVYA